jgi:hypothetical protein
MVTVLVTMVVVVVVVVAVVLVVVVVVVVVVILAVKAMCTYVGPFECNLTQTVCFFSRLCPHHQAKGKQPTHCV